MKNILKNKYNHIPNKCNPRNQLDFFFKQHEKKIFKNPLIAT